MLVPPLPEMESKGGLLKHGVGEFKPAVAMLTLLSSPCELTWKKKGCVLPASEHTQKLSPRVCFLTEENPREVCA